MADDIYPFPLGHYVVGVSFRLEKRAPDLYALLWATGGETFLTGKEWQEYAKQCHRVDQGPGTIEVVKNIHHELREDE